jgi:hypothetical protein
MCCWLLDKFLQVENFKYLGHEISYENEKDIQQKPGKFAQLLGIINNTFKPTLVQKFSRIEPKSRPLEGGGGEIDINRGEKFQKYSRVCPF